MVWCVGEFWNNAMSLMRMRGGGGGWGKAPSRARETGRH